MPLTITKVPSTAAPDAAIDKKSPQRNDFQGAFANIAGWMSTLKGSFRTHR